jgi:hypothetical protein
VSHEPQTDLKDVELQSRIRYRLSAEQRPGFSGIRLQVAQRVAVLGGDVPTHFIRQLALQLVRRVPEVRGVVDQMTVAGVPSGSAPVTTTTFGHSIRTAAGLLILAVTIFTGCNASPSNLNPVQGQVIVNGQPLPNAQVVLRSDDPSIPVAQGQTDAEGKFSLSTFEKHDGAAEGEFKVTVAYYRHIQVEGDLYPGPNVLPQKYSDPARTELRVSVRKGENQLPPITLQL